jgi:hypothetical protein
MRRIRKSKGEGLFEKYSDYAIKGAFVLMIYPVWALVAIVISPFALMGWVVDRLERD